MNGTREQRGKEQGGKEKGGGVGEGRRREGGEAVARTVIVERGGISSKGVGGGGVFFPEDPDGRRFVETRKGS